MNAFRILKWWWVLLCIVALATILAGYAMYRSQFFVLRGTIDEASYRKAKFLLNFPWALRVDSPGGDPNAAYRIAKILDEKNRDLRIIDNCTSACAEFFIPAARKVTANDNALVGYHQSDFFLDYIAINPNDINGYCGLERLKWLKSLYARKGYRQNLHKIVFRELRFSKTKFDLYIDREKSCKNIIMYSYEYGTFYPFSEQIFNNSGIKIYGNLCADSKSCMRK